MAGDSDNTTTGAALQLSDTALIGICFAAAALGLLVLTSSGGESGTATAPEPEAAQTIAVADPVETVADDTFGAQVRSYLLENPEVIFEAVAVYEQRSAAEQAGMEQAMLAANAEALFDDGHSWVGGNLDGDITLVKFNDYRCGFCQRAHHEVATLLQDDGGIRLIVKEFPILGPESELAARFALAVLNLAGAEAYAQANDTMMRHEGAVTPDYLEVLAVGLELDFEVVLVEMEGEAVSTAIAENHDLAQRLQITGTPTFVMETEMIRGFVEADALAQLADALRN